jgi:hypothetical protein
MVSKATKTEDGMDVIDWDTDPESRKDAMRGLMRLNWDHVMPNNKYFQECTFHDIAKTAELWAELAAIGPPQLRMKDFSLLSG